MSMSANYDYVIAKCQAISPKGRLLGYGCGSGEVVVMGRKEGLDIVGVEAFYAGSNARQIAAEQGLLGTVVFELAADGAIPFGSESFDLVVSNQVFEHADDLDLVCGEIVRVLKPGGKLITLFPAREVIREGHCGVPIIHWFAKDSRLRYHYMRLMRALGFGYFKNGKSQAAWSRDFLVWLDRFTVYRTYREIGTVFQRAGLTVCHIEEDYIGFRLARIGRQRLACWVEGGWMRRLARIACRRLGGMVIIASKG